MFFPQTTDFKICLYESCLNCFPSIPKLTYLDFASEQIPKYGKYAFYHTFSQNKCQVFFLDDAFFIKNKDLDLESFFFL